MNYKRKKCQRQGRLRAPDYNHNCRSMGNSDARYYTGSRDRRQAKAARNRVDLCRICGLLPVEMCGACEKCYIEECEESEEIL